MCCAQVPSSVKFQLGGVAVEFVIEEWAFDQHLQLHPAKGLQEGSPHLKKSQEKLGVDEGEAFAPWGNKVAEESGLRDSWQWQETPVGGPDQNNNWK